MASKQMSSSPPRRRILFLLLAIFGVPALLLFLLEIALRVASFGYETDFFLPQKENGEVFLVQNDNFGWQFFPRELARTPSPIRFRKAKEPGTIRIFLFGESAALGDPKPAFGMGRYLQVLLQERYPGQRFEVIPAAMTAINSHALLPIARECSRLGGDYWVLYMGNNEMQGPFGANPISGPAAPDRRFVQATLALRRMKVGQLIETVVQKLVKRNAARQWEGMKMFTEHQVSPNDPRKNRVYANFEHNLRNILAIASSCGAKPIVCTVASNLKDCAPLASVHARQLNPEEGGNWTAFLARGKDFEAAKDFANARDAYRMALRIDEQFAELHYRLANCLLTLGEATNARPSFEQARDLDALPFRTDSRMNKTIHQLSAAAQLLDLNETLGEQSGNAVPGDETFFDHVHFNFAGNYRVARLMAAKIEQTLPSTFAERKSITWASAAICEQRLALTDWNRRAASEQMLQRLAEPPFLNRANQTASVEALARIIIDLRKTISSADPAEARAVYEQAIRENPKDFRLHENFGEFLEAIGQHAEAAAQWLKVAEVLPSSYAAYYQAGRLQSRANQFDSGAANLARALKLRPFFPEAEIEFGLLRFREGKPEQALAYYEKVRKSRSQDARLLIHIADAFAAQKKSAEALAALREAIRIKPDFWEPHYLLGVELASQEKIIEALGEFQAVVRLRPDYPQAHFNLAVALAKLGRLKESAVEFQETLRLDPNHKSAAAYLAQLQGGPQKPPSSGP